MHLLQNGKLELQIDALRRLRTAESEKRSEAVSEVQQLRNQLAEILKSNEELIEVCHQLSLDPHSVVILLFMAVLI